MLQHIERKHDEVFAGNTSAEGVPAYLSELKSARLGEQAFDIEGRKISSAYMRPLFVGQSEADRYDAIMMQRLSEARR